MCSTTATSRTPANRIPIAAGGLSCASAGAATCPPFRSTAIFDEIRHHYDLKPTSDHEWFGIWADVQDADSALESFGVQVTRTLAVARATDLWAPLADGLIRDEVRIETTVRGAPSAGPAVGIRTASWNRHRFERRREPVGAGGAVCLNDVFADTPR